MFTSPSQILCTIFGVNIYYYGVIMALAIATGVLVDEIEIKGKVFSDALGDAWIDVSELKIIKKAPETKKN